MLNVDLYAKLVLAVAIIRKTPRGIPVDLFTRSLAKRIFSKEIREENLENLNDEYLFLRQQDLLSRLEPRMTLSSTYSLMDLSEFNHEEIFSRSNTNEYDYGDFVEKIFRLKTHSNSIKRDDLEFLFDFISKSIRQIDVDRTILPLDICLYSTQIVVSRLQIDNDRPYHLTLELLSLIDQFLDVLFDQLEQTNEKTFESIHQMIIVWSSFAFFSNIFLDRSLFFSASANTCISRLIDKLCFRLRQQCENFFTNEPNEIIDRLFNIFHQLVHNRSHFQRRLSQQSIEKIYSTIHYVVTLLDGKIHYRHLLKLQGQLQAGNYFDPSERTRKYFRNYPSSSSSEHSQCQGTQTKFKCIPPASQSQYFGFQNQ